MCWHNYTQYSGCGHYGEVYKELYTPCHTAHTTITSARGPSAPYIPPPQRSNTTVTSRRRLFSFSRSNSVATATAKTVLLSNNKSKAQFLDSELLPVVQACPELQRRTIVTSGQGVVCAECKKWIDAMRSMISGYDKGRGVKGSAAFKEFLQEKAECMAIAEDLGHAGGYRGRSEDALREMRPLG